LLNACGFAYTALYIAVVLQMMHTQLKVRFSPKYVASFPGFQFFDIIYCRRAKTGSRKVWEHCWYLCIPCLLAYT